MALISCKLCENKISSRARVCPKCGCPNILRTDDPLTKSNGKNCADCEYSGTDGGFSCNLCDDARNISGYKQQGSSMIGRLESLMGSSPADIAKQIESNLLQIIATLDIDDDLRLIFEKIATTEIKKRRLSVNLYEGEDPALSYFSTPFVSASSIASPMALLLGPLSYFAVGLWKKGILLTILVFSLLLGTIFLIPVAAAGLVLMVFLLYLLCYCNLKYDRYRQLVLHESFWW